MSHTTIYYYPRRGGYREPFAFVPTSLIDRARDLYYHGDTVRVLLPLIPQLTRVGPPDEYDAQDKSFDEITLSLEFDRSQHQRFPRFIIVDGFEATMNHPAVATFTEARDFVTAILKG